LASLHQTKKLTNSKSKTKTDDINVKVKLYFELWAHRMALISVFCSFWPDTILHCESMIWASELHGVPANSPAEHTKSEKSSFPVRSCQNFWTCWDWRAWLSQWQIKPRYFCRCNVECRWCERLYCVNV